MTWTHFWDMHSGGGLKEPPYHHIYVEVPEDEAFRYFQDRFGHHPYSVGCECCGENYSVTEYPTLAEATAFHRGRGYGPRVALDDYVTHGDVLVVGAGELGRTLWIDKPPKGRTEGGA